MSKKIPKPCGHLIVVKIPNIDASSKGGIIQYTDPKEMKRQEDGRVEGHIVAIGATAWKDIGEGEAWGKIGDKILFKRYAGIEYRIDNEIVETKEVDYAGEKRTVTTKRIESDLYRIMNDDDMFALLEDEEIV